MPALAPHSNWQCLLPLSTLLFSTRPGCAGVTADLGQTVWSNLTIQGLIQQDAQAIMLIGDLAYAVRQVSLCRCVNPDQLALLCFLCTCWVSVTQLHSVLAMH